MKQLSKMELLNLLGGSVQAHSRCDDLVINANKNGATWSDGEWDLWADQFEVTTQHPYRKLLVNKA